MVDNLSSDESDDERGKKEILQRMECFNRLFVVPSSSILDGHRSCCMINFRMSKIVFTSLLIVLETRYNLQTSRHISSREMLGIFCTSWAPVQKFSNIEKDFKGLEQ
ncbi:hypothetical protein Gotur_006928 [Gossypium turneri]